MANRAPTFSLQRIIFLAVSLVLCVQVGWWINVQIRESGRLLEARAHALSASRAEAWQMDSLRVLSQIHMRPDPSSRTGSVEGRFAALPTLEERRQTIQSLYPHVAVVPTPHSPDDLVLLDGAAFLTLRPEPLIELKNQRWHSVLRAATEGAFMVVAVLLGFVLIYRKLAEELDLKLRQRNFTSAITHELKTPIASLRVWTETLFTRNLPGEQRQRIHGLMERDLDRLNELVSNLLDVARAESGSLVLHQAPLELEPWLRGVCEGMDLRLGAGALGLRLEFTAEPLWVSADAKALATVIENLLSNAYKYAAEPRQTTITLDGDGEDALIVVSDLGHGISPKDLPRIFHRFFRVGDEMTRRVAGTGLGLFLVKEIITRHGGEVRVSSRGTGLGSAFTLRLPGFPSPRMPDVNGPSEALLVQAAVHGDAGAFEALVRPHLGMLFRVIDRILGNEAESQDALQDALLTLHRELPGFHGGSKFSTWAYRICVNQALMARRKRVRRREDAIEDLMPRFGDEGHHMQVDTLLDWSEEAEALMKVEREELKARVRQGLDRLSDDQRAVFVLRDLEGWNTDEIATHLGLTRELVRQRVHRARLALRALLPEFAPRQPEGR